MLTQLRPESAVECGAVAATKGYVEPPLKLSLRKGMKLARKCVEENERIKRRYLQFQREARRADMATVDKAADAILRFERSTGFKPLKRFHIEQAVKFKAQLSDAKNENTGKPLSKATVDSTLHTVKAFVHWLAGQQGYRSRISCADAEYFNLNAKDARVAHTERETPFPDAGTVPPRLRPNAQRHSLAAP